MPAIERSHVRHTLNERLRARADSEHELSLNRLVMVTLIIGWLGLATAFGSSSAAQAIQIVWVHILIYCGVSLSLFLNLLRAPGVSPIRRVVGIFNDIGLFSIGLHFCGEAGAALFPIYLWVVLGYGFRFGRRYLALATMVAVVGFGAMAALTPFWMENSVFALGIIIALTAIPIYASGLVRRLWDAKRTAEEASRAKSLFLASVSHELRTPLNAIIGLSDLIGEVEEDERRNMIRILRSSAGTLLALIDTLLDFSRVESGRMAPRREEVDLARLLSDIRDVVGVEAWSKGVRVALHVTARTPRRVITDARHLNEILTNLAGNAVKFTESGHVLIAIDVIATADGRAKLHVEVRDTGMGIAAEAQNKIFETFTQADATIIDRFGGTGLGLSIVRQLARLHGGEVDVKSRLGEGACFTVAIDVELPEAASAVDDGPPRRVVLLAPFPVDLPGASEVVRVDEPDAALRLVAEWRRAGRRRPVVIVDANAWRDRLAEVGRCLTRAGGADEPRLALLVASEIETVENDLRPYFSVAVTPMSLACVALFDDRDHGECRSPDVASCVSTVPTLSVLVADDNRVNRMVIRKVLERAGHRVEEVADGEAALDAMLGTPFDAVLMDLNMPLMNGIDATQLYRMAAGDRAPLPVIALTADATQNAERRCLEAGLDACLTKPIDAERLLTELAAVVAAARERSVASSGTAAPEARGDTAKERLEACPVVDRAKLAELEDLGGTDFVDELVEEFVDQAAIILRSLVKAVAEEDVAGFRERAHALRSGAANVGAARIHRMCLDWRAIDARELALRGERHLTHLEAEFQRAKIEMDALRRSKR